MLLEKDLVNVVVANKHIKFWIIKRLHVGTLDTVVIDRVYDEVNLLLAFFHIWNVIIEWNQLFLIIVSACESKKFEQSIFVFLIASNALLYEYVKFRKPSLVLLRISLGLIVDHLDDSPGQNVPQFGDEAWVLIVLTGDVQRQIFAVNDTFYEAQVVWQEFSAFLFDKDFARVKMDCSRFWWETLLLTVRAGNVHDSLNCERNISRVVEHVFVGYLRVGNLLEEADIFVYSHVSLLSIPDGTKGVHSLAIDFNRVADELRELLHYLLHHDFLTVFSSSW